jgi:hypothetical protein
MATLTYQQHGSILTSLYRLTLRISEFLMIALLFGVRGYLTVILIRTPLIINDIEHLSHPVGFLYVIC